MCLQRFEDFNVRLNKDGIGTGYKVFYERAGKLYGEYARPQKKRRVGIWLKEQNFRPQRIDTGLERSKRWQRYKRGWHIFLTRSDALIWATDSQAIIRIKFKGIVTMGRASNNSKVIVAKEIFIPREV